MVQTLSVPCGCHCRYCLLSWDGHTVGADYARCKSYAKRFHEYIQENRPEIQFNFTFGYCMEHTNLLEELDFMNSIGSVQGRFLQMDGMRIRTPEETMKLMAGLRAHGVQQINMTFYGLREYHDRFAARRGDFDFLLLLGKFAMEQRIALSAGIPLTSENADSAEELLNQLDENGFVRTSLFVPHGEGRGAALESVRFTQTDFERLGEKAKSRLNTCIFRTEAQWLQAQPVPEEENRSLLLSLTPENIDLFERMDFEETIRYLEQLDEAYYAAIPTFQELCIRYGNPVGAAFYRKRDLYQHFQKRYIRENNLSLTDVTDERFCGSRRY